ncbi:MAG: ribosome biogenesis GTPase Der [Clostridiales bacterium]|nr:ribosome biogenesis GTPase Der [Clostridiales bacterium]
MGKPILAIVGRPNVGKSTLFNKIAGRRISIVEDYPGVTRDRVYAEGEWLNRKFTMIDTGGLEPDSKDIIVSQMKKQAEIAIELADVILFMVDAKEGITSADEEIAQLLRMTKKPILLVVNKSDKPSLPDSFYDFYTLGVGEPIPISSVNALNLGDLLDEVLKLFPDESEIEGEEEMIKVAIIGKPNVGKSSLLNKIFGEERVIVSPIAGTTRESIDTEIEIDGKHYRFIDTAGIRKRKKIDENVERYSVLRSFASIEHSDICLLLIDASEGVTDQDKKIAGYAHEEGKGIIIVVNKWDKIEKDNTTFNSYIKKIKNELTFLGYAQVMFISALTGQRVNQIIKNIDYVHQNQTFRISTGLLNDIFNEAIMLNQPPSDKGKRLKIYYVTQVGTIPPRFIVFVNDIGLAHFSYMRYLENKLRENFNFEGTPIILSVRPKRN